MAKTVKARQRKAQSRAEQARRLREEHPEASLSWIGAELGVSKQRVSQLLAAGDGPAQAWKNSDDRWPDDMVRMMVEQLAAGAAPRDLLALPGVADMIAVKVDPDDLDPARVAELGKAKALLEKQDQQRMLALRVMISRGQKRPKSSVAGRLYAARQAGKDRRAA